MQNTPKKRRFSFWKVALWVTIVNLFFVILTVVIIYYVKLPNISAHQLALFSLTRYLVHAAVSIVFQCFYYYFALNSFYRLVSRKARWHRYLLVSLVYILLTFVFAAVGELIEKSDHLKDVLDLSLRV